MHSNPLDRRGLITYREVALLYEANKSSLSDREYVATVVAHELAHQWFGDLVTMEWWDG
jgi:aminopeptidase N